MTSRRWTKPPLFTLAGPATATQQRGGRFGAAGGRRASHLLRPELLGHAPQPRVLVPPAVGGEPGPVGAQEARQEEAGPLLHGLVPGEGAHGAEGGLGGQPGHRGPEEGRPGGALGGVHVAAEGGQLEGGPPSCSVSFS